MSLKQDVINATAEFIFSDQLKAAFEEIKGGVAAVPLMSIIPDYIVSAIRDDLKKEKGWRKEFWILDDDNSVHLVDESDFSLTELSKRFSNNETLRGVSNSADALAGFLLTIKSKKVQEHLSKLFGENVSFCTSDIARYSKEQYLRRHSDLFDNRQFGIVSFFNEQWSEGNGSEFIVEGLGGDSYVIPPKPGNAVLLTIKPGFQHQVAVAKGDEWTRYSIAAHYNIPK